MENGIIQCPRCDTDNPVESDICYICGAALHVQSPQKAGKKWLYGLFIAVIFIGVGGFCYFQFFTSEPPKKLMLPAPTPKPLEQKEKINLPAPSALPEASADIQKRPAADKQPFPEKTKLITGVVVIRDITDKPMTQLVTPVLAGGWIALPRRVCLGGYQWVLKLDEDNELSIVQGIIGNDDPIGLWRIAGDQTIKGPELAPWVADQPVVWLSLQHEAQPKPVKIAVLSKQHYFIKGTLAENINEPGVLFQQ
ncbi:MAG: hypothetical protein JSV83_02035, partial [Desulfobacterales bacterium]